MSLLDLDPLGLNICGLKGMIGRKFLKLWNENETGSCAYKLSSKIKSLTKNLKKWNKEESGNVLFRIEQLNKRLGKFKQTEVLIC